MTPSPTPPEVPAVEIWQDYQCTVRPSLGVEYANLYIKFNRVFDFGDSKVWDEPGQQKLEVAIPTSGPYEIYYCTDWYVKLQEDDIPIQAGDVFELTNLYPDVLPEGAVFDFYD